MIVSTGVAGVGGDVLQGGIVPYESDVLPILVTWYDPALGGINCDVDCTTLADGLGWDEFDYGRSAACLPTMLGGYVTFGGMTYRCRDTGGGIEVEYDGYWQRWVMRVDIMSDEPIDCNYCLYAYWQFGYRQPLDIDGGAR